MKIKLLVLILSVFFIGFLYRVMTESKEPIVTELQLNYDE